MYPDNAETATAVETVEADYFDGLTDRELLLFIARNMHAVTLIAEEVQEVAAPVIEKLSSNPMFKMILGR